MSGWWVRWRQRQTELADGVDADLVRDNRRRWKMALGLLGGGFVLGLVVPEVRLSTTLRTIVTILAVAAWTIGAVMINWAIRERRFLNQPDPERPPSIFKG